MSTGFNGLNADWLEHILEGLHVNGCISDDPRTCLCHHNTSTLNIHLLNHNYQFPVTKIIRILLSSTVTASPHRPLDRAHLLYATRAACTLCSHLHSEDPNLV